MGEKEAEWEGEGMKGGGEEREHAHKLTARNNESWNFKNVEKCHINSLQSSKGIL